MRTVVLSLSTLALVTACVSPGQRWNYQMNRQRTSPLIREATAVAQVTRRDLESTEFRVETRARPVLGSEVIEVQARAFDNAVLSAGTIDELRRTREIVDDDYRATYVRRDGACDWVKLDRLPDTARAKDVVITAKVCSDGFPTVDVALTAQGQRVTIGFDRR